MCFTTVMSMDIALLALHHPTPPSDDDDATFGSILSEEHLPRSDSLLSFLSRSDVCRRLLAVAGTFDALTARRAYALMSDGRVVTIQLHGGRHFTSCSLQRRTAPALQELPTAEMSAIRSYVLLSDTAPLNKGAARLPLDSDTAPLNKGVAPTAQLRSAEASALQLQQRDGAHQTP